MTGVAWKDYAVTCRENEMLILRDIMRLHNGGNAFDVDPCYSVGRFWQDLPQPLHKFDLEPQTPDTLRASADALPLPDASVRSIMFDPPFIPKNVQRANAKLGKIEKRFSGFKSISALWTFYNLALIEFARILTPGGIVVVKCQDTLSGGKQYWSHVELIQAASALGFTLIDLFVLYRERVLWSPNMVNQKHARKNHSYFLVFQK